MIRFEPAETPTRDQLDDASVEVGLHLLDLLPATSTHPAQQIYLAPDRMTLIHLVEAPRPGRLSIVLQGPAEEALADVLAARFPAAPALPPGAP